MKDLSETYFPFGCDFCEGKVILRDDKEIYGEDRGRKLWVCENFPKCNTYISAHSRPEFNFMPVGTLADQKVRELRKEAHYYFDHLWMLLPEEQFRRIHTVCTDAPATMDGVPMKPRMTAYWWLAGEMGIEYYNCAISKFNEEQCRQAISICQRISEKFNYYIPEKYLK